MSAPSINASDTTRAQAISDIIESIALEQAALGHILNAEGEKIQKVVATAATQDQLLDVNESINATVRTVTNLEIVLQNKLSLFSTCLCGGEDGGSGGNN